VDRQQHELAWLESGLGLGLTSLPGIVMHTVMHM